MSTTLRLEADGLDSLELNRDNGIVVGSYERTSPEIRSSVEPRVDAHGDYDTTTYHGGGLVTMQMSLVPTATLTKKEVQDRLNQFCLPSRRPYLYVDQEGDGDERRIRLRPDTWSGPLTIPVYKAVQYQWRAPDGVEESATEVVETVFAAGDIQPGRSYPFEYPKEYPVATIIGAVTITNDGNVSVDPVLRLYGPCTDPRIENTTVDKRYIFSGLVLAEGEYVEVDARNRTVRLNGDASLSRYHLLDFALTDWWGLDPGDNSIRFYPEIYSGVAQAQITFRPAWI